MASDPVNVTEFEEIARQALPKMYFDFYRGGAEDEFTLRENIKAFQRILLRPRVLVDVRSVDMSTTLLGYDISAPIIIAPTSSHRLAHPEGEVATARAAAACNTIMALSFSSSCTIEEVASSCNAVRFFQLYMYKNRDISAKLVERAERNGYKAIFLTVDTVKLGRREADCKNKLILPMSSNLKGLISLDSVLEEVVGAVSGAIPVLIDGGFRRGTDVFKALALGAKAIMIGRPVIFGLAAKGEQGARQVIEMLKSELELTMSLTGCPTIKDISRSHVLTPRDRLRSFM